MNTLKGGYFCLALWVVVSAIARIIAHGALAHLSPLVVCFYVFSAAQGFFLLLNGRKLWLKRRQIRSRWKIIILLNLVTIGAWYGSLFPLNHLPPTLVSSSVTACSSLFAWGFSRFKTHPPRSANGDLELTLGLFVLGVALLGTSRGTAGWLTSAAWCLIASFSIAATANLSKSLAFSVGESLALRFWALIAFSWVGAMLSGKRLVPGLDSAVPLASLVLLYGILPLYLIQVSINALEPLTITSAMPFIPLTIYCLETRLGGTEYSSGVQAVLAAIFFASLATVVRRYRAETADSAPQPGAHSEEFTRFPPRSPLMGQK